MRTFLRSSLVIADMLGVSGMFFVQWSGLCDCVRQRKEVLDFRFNKSQLPRRHFCPDVGT